MSTTDNLNPPNPTAAEETRPSSRSESRAPKPSKAGGSAGRTVALLVVVGVAAVGGALWWRHRIVSNPTFRFGIAMADPRVQGMRDQFEQLEGQIASHPDDVKLRWKLADMFQKVGMLDQAAPQLEQIVRVEPKSADAMIALGNVYLATGQTVKAEGMYRRMVELYPKSAAAWQGLATVLYHQDRFWECIGAIRKAVVLEPTNPNHRFILADALLHYVSQFPTTAPYAEYAFAAQKELQKLLPVWPEPGDIEARLGSASLLLRDNKAAIDHFLKAIARMPTRPDLYSSVAVVYIGVGDRANARRIVDEGLKRCRPTADLYDLQGQLIQSSGEPQATERSLAAYQQAVKLASQGGGPPPYRYLEHLGTAQVRVNKLPEARDTFEQVVLLMPDRAFAYQQLSAIYTRLGDIPHATAAAKMATRMVFNDQQLRQIQLLSQAHPDAVNLQTILADRYRALHLRGAARDKYLQVLQLEPGNKHAQEALAAMAAEKPAGPPAAAPAGESSSALTVPTSSAPAAPTSAASPGVN